MVSKSNSKITKELDLRKFILRQRLQTIAILGLLNGRQSLFADKMSQMVIRDSSNLDESSSDDELSDWQRDDMIYVKRMMQSHNKVDARLLKLFKVRQAKKLNIHLGFTKRAEDPNKSRYKRTFSTLLKNEIFVPLEGLPQMEKSRSVKNVESKKLLEETGDKEKKQEQMISISLENKFGNSRDQRKKNYRVTESNWPSSPGQIELRDFSCSSSDQKDVS